MTKFFIAFVSVLVFWACGEAPTYTEEKVHLRLEKGDEVVEVTCNSGTGAGAVNGTQCEETWDNCSDGSVYEVFCVFNAEAELTECECYTDGTRTKSFSTSQSCQGVNRERPMTSADLIAGCGWGVEDPLARYQE